MPVVADYSIIRDSSFVIRTGGDIDRTFNFTMPSFLYPSNRAILAYVIDGERNTTNLKVEISINGSVVRHPRFSGDSYKALHEVVAANLLREGSNSIKFRITSGSGPINISDVILWWQRTV